MARPITLTFPGTNGSASSTVHVWTPPPRVYRVFIQGVGGGGGGGGGFWDVTAGNNRWSGGGGGGGGALLGSLWLDVIPGVALTITCGRGGPGGLGNVAPSDGTSGGDSTVTGLVGLLARFPGGQGGTIGFATGINTMKHFSRGGFNVREGALSAVFKRVIFDTAVDPNMNLRIAAEARPGEGGPGAIGTADSSVFAGGNGGSPPFVLSNYTSTGGVGGTHGADNAAARGGGGGGGGGGGPWGGGGGGGGGGGAAAGSNGLGGAGGAGGDLIAGSGVVGNNGQSTTFGGQGGAGGNADTSTGAGGGGGGGHGHGSSGNGGSGAGGNGGSGRVMITYFI